MTTLTITLPDDLAKTVQEKGLLSPTAIEAYVREQIMTSNKSDKCPPGFDPQLHGAASPELMGTVKYHDDIVAPLALYLRPLARPRYEIL